MRVSKKILLWLIIIVVLFTIQTITFFILGPIQLKNNLLPNYFRGEQFYTDSAFVRDYYTTDCTTGDHYVVYHPLNLKSDSEELKQKLGAQFICFANRETSDYSDTLPNKYPVFYEVFARSADWRTLFDFYGCRVDEHLHFDHSRHIEYRQTNYRWILFTWVPTFEYWTNWDNE